MIIRAEQQSQVAIELFVKRLQEHWLENFPYKFADIPKDEIKQICINAVNEAESKGILYEDLTIIHSDLCLLVGTGFAAKLENQEKPNV